MNDQNQQPTEHAVPMRLMRNDDDRPPGDVAGSAIASPNDGDDPTRLRPVQAHEVSASETGVRVVCRIYSCTLSARACGRRFTEASKALANSRLGIDYGRCGHGGFGMSACATCPIGEANARSKS